MRKEDEVVVRKGSIFDPAHAGRTGAGVGVLASLIKSIVSRGKRPFDNVIGHAGASGLAGLGLGGMLGRGYKRKIRKEEGK